MSSFAPRRQRLSSPCPSRRCASKSSNTHDEARRLAPGWDVYVLENEWRSWVHDKAIDVKDADKHFLAFCKKRGAYKN